jgi:hypothetical protein
MIHTVYTQSAQDICISGNTAYFAAQDSIVKLNLDNNQRIAAVADSGLNKLFLYGNRLIVSKQYPVTTFFAEVLDTADLSLVASIGGISGDCGGIVAAGDSVYIAVNDGWMGTEGKIAVIETTGWTLVRMISMGADAIGMMNLYLHNNKIFTVNKSPFLNPEVGSVTVYDLSDHTILNKVFPKNVGTGTGVNDHLLYFGLGYGIGSFNMNTLQVEDTVVVADPGSSSFRYITSATVDSLNDRLYVNTGDYFSPGTCLVTTLTGDSVTSYATGISSEAVAVDYRQAPLGISTRNPDASLLTVHPNPVSDMLYLKFGNQQYLREVIITDFLGRSMARVAISKQTDFCSIPVGSLHPGLFIVVIHTDKHTISGKFIKK